MSLQNAKVVVVGGTSVWDWKVRARRPPLVR
jgi:hypothetical protein